MAGVKGRSGGPRANAGGTRPGAGRKPKAVKESANETAVQEGLEPQAHGGALKRKKATVVAVQEDLDMVTFLERVALGRIEATNIQVRAAIAAAQYKHTKKGDGGKKEEQDAAAQAVASKFRRSAPPKLAAVGGQKV